MKITLIHNPGAGSGQAADDLVGLLTEAGHKVRHRSTEDDWEPLLERAADLVLAAGGDGTVRKVALAAADRGLPFAVFPIGTANNIAKTLGVLGGARELVETWSTSHAEQPFDIGEVVAPWGRERFIEGLGCGPVADLISRGAEVVADATLLGRETDRALHLFGEIIREAPAQRWKIDADGEDLSGDYLAVELLNTRFVGPNVPWSPSADTGDGLLDVVLVGEADREPLLAYLDNRLHLASGLLPDLHVVRARRIKLTVPAGVRCHLDDQLWPSDKPRAKAASLRVKCRAGAATFGGVVGR